jgi:uncharacterized protein (UPF0297 family)
MRKESDVKYPNSANLFRFCRRVLDHKYGGIRVIDQDVGQILSFDPADCSHWKKGKKNIRSIQAMKNIADHLGIDQKLVVDVASGDMDDAEAFCEYNGYGSLAVDSNIVEAAKKAFYRKHAAAWTKEKEQSFREFFEPQEKIINELVKEIHGRLNYSEPPLYLPEITAAYGGIQLVPDPAFPGSADANPVEVVVDGQTTKIRYKSGTETQPYMRYRIAKAIGMHFLPKRNGESEGLGEYVGYMQDVESNIFANRLLAPANLIRNEMAQLNVGRDVISQLSESFWVSKVFMNSRLKSILQDNADL